MTAGTEPIGRRASSLAGAPGARRLATAAAIALGLGLAAPAGAQPSSSGAATLAFDKGRALMKEKKYAEACAAFEQSHKLDPQIGTLYNLGLCYTELGKVASAWNALREVGQRDTKASRKQDANKRARELEKRLPKLLLTIDAAPPGLVVTMDGVDVTAFIGTDSPVDPAAYALKATAPGHAAWETTAQIAEEGKTTTIAIELPRLPAKDPVEPGAGTGPARSGTVAPGGDRTAPPPRPPDYAAGQRRKVMAVAAWVAASTAITAGLSLGSLAWTQWNIAQIDCPGGVCDDTQAFNAASPHVDSAKSYASWATGFTIAGGVLAVAGTVLWFTAPSGKAPASTAIRIAPRLGPGHAALMLEGRFP